MAIGDDWTIDYTNKRIYHSSGTTVYTVNELYSYLQDTFDEPTQMDDKVPMSAQTPTAYTMINGWWLDISATYESHKYLKGGAIATSGYDASSNNDGIRLLKLESSGYTNCVASDIGKQVGYSGGSPADTGTLLGYDNTRRYWWVRVDDTGDTFSDTSTALDIDDGSGTGAGNLIDSGGSVTGEELYANVYTLGTIETNPYPQIYIFQQGERIAEWSSLSNWDRGHIDVLIQVKEAGSEIDGANITVFARQEGDLFDNFEIDLTSGGRSAVPLSTSEDLNNATGDYYIFYDNESSGPFQAKEIISSSGGGWDAEVVSVTDWGTEGMLEIRGVKGTISDNDSFTGGTSGATADINGTVGDTYLEYDAETSTFTVGAVLTGGTSGAKRKIVGLQDDGTTGKLLLQVDTTVTGSSRAAYYKDFQDDETITDDNGTPGSATANGDSTTVVSGYSDITIAFVNGTVSHGGTTGTFTAGERVTWSGGEGIVLYDSGSELTLGNCTSTSLNGKAITGDLSGASCTASQDLQSAHTMNKAFQQQSAYPYDVIINAGDIYNTGRTLADVYEYLKFVTQSNSTYQMYTVVSSVITPLDGEEYIQAYTGYTPTKQSPFGTFAGGKFFGAQGVWIEGMASDQSYQFIDSNGNVRTPYTSITISVTNVVSGDRVAVFRTTGGSIDKSIYTSHATSNTDGNTSFVIQESIDTDVPSSGTLRVVDTSTSEEQRYRYSSWSGSTFTLKTGAAGSATSGSTGQTLVDSAADFGGTDDVQVGDVIRNTTTAESGYVVSIDSSTQLTTAGLSSGWSVSDNYDTNKLDRDYGGIDTCYVPFIDTTATSTTAQVTILYNSDRTVLIRVRKKGILPFETSGTVGSSGLSVSAIRTTDSIVA